MSLHCLSHVLLRSRAPSLMPESETYLLSSEPYSRSHPHPLTQWVFLFNSHTRNKDQGSQDDHSRCSRRERDKGPEVRTIEGCQESLGGLGRGPPVRARGPRKCAARM